MVGVGEVEVLEGGEDVGAGGVGQSSFGQQRELGRVVIEGRMSGSSGDFERRSIQMLCVVRLIIL